MEETIMTKKDISEKDIKEMLRDFGVKTEDELIEKMEKTWNKVRCCRCGKTIYLETCYFTNDEAPICPGGCK